MPTPNIQLRLFKESKPKIITKIMKVNFKEMRCKIKRIYLWTYRDGYGGYGDFASLKFIDDQGRYFAIYGFRIYRNNGKLYLEKPKGIFAEESLWKMIEGAVLSQYEYEYPALFEE